MDKLPCDLLFHIFNSLTIYRISQITICCKLFQSIVVDPYFWKQWFVYNKLDSKGILDNDNHIMTNLKNAYCWKMEDRVIQYYNSEIISKMADRIYLKNPNPNPNFFCIKNILDPIENDVDENKYNKLNFIRGYVITTNQIFTPFRNKIRVKNIFTEGYQFKFHQPYGYFMLLRGNRRPLDGRYTEITNHTDKITFSKYITDESYCLLCQFGEKLDFGTETMFGEYTVEVDFNNKKIIFENKEKQYKKEIVIDNPKDIRPNIRIFDYNAIEIY